MSGPDTADFDPLARSASRTSRMATRESVETLKGKFADWTPDRREVSAFADGVLKALYERAPSEATRLILALNEPAEEARFFDLMKLAVLREVCLEEVAGHPALALGIEETFAALEAEWVPADRRAAYRIALALLVGMRRSG